MDISKLSLAAGTSFLHLRHPVTDEPLFDGTTENPIPVGVHLYGPGTAKFSNAQFVIQNRALRRQAAKTKVDAKQLRSETDDFLATCTHSVQALTQEGLTPVTHADFVVLYATPGLSWVRSQVDEYLADPANFMGESKQG